MPRTPAELSTDLRNAVIAFDELRRAYEETGGSGHTDTTLTDFLAELMLAGIIAGGPRGLRMISAGAEAIYDEEQATARALPPSGWTCAND